MADEMEDDEEKDPTYLPQDMELEEYVGVHVITAICELLATYAKWLAELWQKMLCCLLV